MLSQYNPSTASANLQQNLPVKLPLQTRATNLTRPLKGLTPYEIICQCWTNEPERSTLNPLHQMLELNN
jgi:hypothetical protein